MSKNTKGELACGLPSMPNEAPAAKRIRLQSARLIDSLEELRRHLETSPNTHRLISIAQTEVETACMYGVKAVYAVLVDKTETINQAEAEDSGVRA